MLFPQGITRLDVVSHNRLSGYRELFSANETGDFFGKRKQESLFRSPDDVPVFLKTTRYNPC